MNVGILVLAMMAGQAQQSQKSEKPPARPPTTVCKAEPKWRGPSIAMPNMNGECAKLAPPAQMQPVKDKDGRVLYCVNAAPPQPLSDCSQGSQPKGSSK